MKVIEISQRHFAELTAFKWKGYIFHPFRLVLTVVCSSLPHLIGFFNKLFPVCFLYPDNATGTLAFAFIFLSLAFDTILFSLTLLYTSRALRSYTPSHLLRSLQRDGVFYFFFVLCANVCWMSFIQHARASASPHKLEAILTKRYLFSLH